jgi:hypothetical protein
MAVSKIELKRSAVPGKVPTTSSLDLGELALNTYDGRAFFKQSGSITTIVELLTISGSVTSASYALTASYAMNGGGGGVTFPYSGSAQITGSLGVTGSFSVSGFSIFNGTISGSQPANNPSSSLILISGTINPTGSAGTGSAVLLNTVMSASANNQTLVGLDINPTFTNGAFTGVRNIALRSSGDIQVANNVNINALKTTGQPFLLAKMDATDSIVFGNNQSATQLLGVGIEFRTGAGLGAKLFNTNNFTIQNAGTYVDAGFRLDVSGSTRLNGNTQITGSLNVSGSITTTGTITAQTLVVQTVSSSIIYSSGSNIFGNKATDTQRFTGSLLVSGSITVSGSVINNLTASYTISASSAISSSYPINIAGTTLYLADNSVSSFSTTNGIFLGINTGYLASGANDSNFLGSSAGYQASSANNSNFLGNGAGYNASNSNYSNFLGNAAGYDAPSADHSNFLGSSAGYQATSANYSNFLGHEAGYNASGANDSIFIGHSPGYQATNAYKSNFIGQGAGQLSTDANNSNFIGIYAGYNAPNSDHSNFLGPAAGANATNASSSNFLGTYAGYNAYSASYSTLLGFQAGYNVSTAGINRNNIIIGTNITLPDNYQNGINIGGIIFGSGSYFDSSLNQPFSGSANGRIGINKPNPNATLDVSGSVLVSGSITVSGSVINNLTASFAISASQALTASYILASGVVGLNLSQIATGSVTASVSLGSGSFSVTSGSSTFLFISSSGNIGVNTSFPTSSLYVSGAANTPFQAVFAASSTSANYLGGIQLGNAGGNQNAQLLFDATSDNKLTIKTSYAAGTGNAIVFAPGGTERVRFMQSGNVGINKTAPSASLDVSGSVLISGSLSITGSSYSFNNTLNTYFITSSAPSGSNVIFSQPTGSYTSAFFKYTISSGSNARAGEVISVWNSTTSSYTDYTTTDIGNTSTVTSLVAISGNNVVYTVSSSNGGWTIKSLVVYI